jgi:polyamine oxidase
MYVDPDVRGRYTVWQNINAPGFFPSNTTQNVIMVTAIDNFARRNEQLSDDEIMDETYGVLQEMYGAGIPRPVDILVPRWSVDPLFRGSYSNWPLGALDQHHENLRKRVGSSLHFSGEAMSEEAFGYVQGAWDEGINSADEVAQCLTSGGCEVNEVFEALVTCEQAETALRKRDGKKTKKRGGQPRRRHGGFGRRS